MKHSRVLFTWFLCFILLFTSMPLMSGCSTEEPSQLLGVVEIDNPIEGSTISIYDTNGKLLHREDNVTSETGAFILEIPKALPVDFRIEATGGMDNIDDEPFTGVISAEIRGHDEQNYSYYHLGLASTLLASYMGTHPKMQYEEARTIVIDFLDLYPDIDIMTDLISYKHFLNPEIFKAEAQKAGGFNDFIDLMTDQVDTEGAKYSNFVTSPFGAGPVTLGIGGLVAKTILLGLLEGAANKIGGESVGWVLKQIRGGDSSTETQRELDNISNRLGQLSAEIIELKNEVAAGFAELKGLVERSTYETRATMLNEPMSKIETAWNRITYAAASLDASDPNHQNAADTIIGSINTAEIESALQQIHTTLVDQPGVPGLTRAWGEMQLKNPQKSWADDKYYELENQFTYYAAIQLTGLTVLIEKYHADNLPNSMIEQAIEKYQNNIKTQGDLFLTSVESILAWHCQCSRNNHPVYQEEWSFEWNFSTTWPVVKNVLESKTLDKADTIVGDLIGRQNSIIIRIHSYNRDLNRPDMGFFEMSLDHGIGRNQITDSIKPGIITIHYPKLGDSSCPPMFTKKDGYYGQIARFSFFDLDPGTYYIHDNNNNWISTEKQTLVKGKVQVTKIYMINNKLLNLPFVISDQDPYHNQLIYPWLSEIGY
ncbi:hypothetical protein ACFLTT_01720 [Chloroflexota bacterium]